MRDKESMVHAGKAERERERERQTDRQTDRLAQAGSMLSAEPDPGLDPTTVRS